MFPSDRSHESEAAAAIGSEPRAVGQEFQTLGRLDKKMYGSIHSAIRWLTARDMAEHGIDIADAESVVWQPLEVCQSRSTDRPIARETESS